MLGLLVLSTLAVFYSFAHKGSDYYGSKWYERFFVGALVALIFGAIVYGLLRAEWEPARIAGAFIGFLGLISPLYSGA
jgi:hypothetical protein